MKLHLDGANIQGCSSLPPSLEFMGTALGHQVAVYEQSLHADVILDLAPTGTGKTKAGLLTLKHNPFAHAIYIAPTNALIEQQADEAKIFLREAGLNHLVLPASAARIREWPGNSRPGEKLYNMLREPAIFFPEAAGRPVLLVTNPDIFYYAIFFGYQSLDQRNVASTFIQKFHTIIFDEFHLYDAKQLVGLLFYLILSQVLGYFGHGRKIVLLTATPEPACDGLLTRLQDMGTRIARITGEGADEPLLPSQSPVSLELRCQPSADEFVNSLAEQVASFYREYPGAYGAVILDSLDRINRLADKLQSLRVPFGRITGPVKSNERREAMTQPVILATQTVDVGFNFERNPLPKRQNLDWLIFSAKDRGSFWQRLGRVGRVLGKSVTTELSQAIAYLPERAWEKISQLPAGNITRQALAEHLLTVPELQRPFQDIYWRSEALLEVARPVWQLQELLGNLEQAHLIEELFESVRRVVADGKGQSWGFYQSRVKMINAARQIAHNPKDCLKAGGGMVVKAFLKAERPSFWMNVEEGLAKLQDYTRAFAERAGADADQERADLKAYAERLWASYSPLFRFRQGLFNSLEIRDPRSLVSDLDTTVSLDPLHLLRNYEFDQRDKEIELLGRPDSSYIIKLNLTYLGCREEFENLFLNRPTALKDVAIQRQTRDGGIVVTPLLADLLKMLEKEWLPGVLICPKANGGAFFRLSKMGLQPFDMKVEFTNDFTQRDYAFYPHLEGWLALAREGVRLRLPDSEEPWII